MQIQHKILTNQKVVRMVITAVVDRFENGNAVLLAEDMGMEISIPTNTVRQVFKKGEVLYLTIDRKNNIKLTDERG